MHRRNRWLPVVLASLALGSLSPGMALAARRRSVRPKAAPRVLHVEAEVLKLDTTVGKGASRPGFVRGYKRLDMDTRTHMSLRLETEFEGVRTIITNSAAGLTTEVSRPGGDPQRSTVQRKELPQFAQKMQALAKLENASPEIEWQPQREKLLGVWCRVMKLAMESESENYEVWTWIPDDPDLRNVLWLKTLRYHVTGEGEDTSRELVSGEIVLSLRKSLR